MSKPLIVSLFLISFAAIGQQKEKIGKDLPNVYRFDSSDKEMNAAIAKSRQTFDDFLTAFKNQKRTQRSFCVKLPVATTAGDEYVWITNLELKGEKLIGQLDNLLEKPSNLKLGDKIEINRNKISDWFYIENNKLVGGLTIRVFRNRMTPAQRELFDKQFGVKFD